MTAISTPQPPQRVDTKTKLVLAAERLFAQHGIDGVTLRQITRAAGQRNESALHYHFRTREALIAAIFTHRTAAIDAYRNTLIDDLEQAGGSGDLRRLVEALVVPMSAPLRERRDENHYNRFLAEVLRSPSVNVRDVVGQNRLDSGIRRLFAHIGRVLDHIPERLLRQRCQMAMNAITYALADIEAVMTRREQAGSRFDLLLAIDNLIDQTAAGLAAEPSAATRRRLICLHRSEETDEENAT